MRNHFSDERAFGFNLGLFSGIIGACGIATASSLLCFAALGLVLAAVFVRLK